MDGIFLRPFDIDHREQELRFIRSHIWCVGGGQVNQAVNTKFINT